MGLVGLARYLSFLGVAIVSKRRDETDVSSASIMEQGSCISDPKNPPE